MGGFGLGDGHLLFGHDGWDIAAPLRATARSRRRRVKRFIMLGAPASAQITAIRQEKVAFDVQMSRVSYQFEADGAIHRDVDDVLPVVADRWRPGDTIQVLYLADRDYDSIIVSR